MYSNLILCTLSRRNDSDTMDVLTVPEIVHQVVAKHSLGNAQALTDVDALLEGGHI
jgi:hypothetical protein